MTANTDRLNTALAGRYRIERQLGQGGMATVYLAADLKHDRKVAVKVLKPELAAVLGAERFVVEIKTTASLQHPHILPLFDSGTADGFLFYVMPYIEGETIREKLNRETQFGVDEAVRIAREVADALDYAHRHGVIHRDIKPENLLLHDGRAMVMDFGIALAVSAAAGGRMTETGLSLGTPHYMSPEQATAEKDITARSDVYSLASVLFEMLAGEPPHSAGSAQAVIMKIITETAAPLTSLRKSVPPNVGAAVAKALEKLPADRFESAKGFADALGNPAYASSSGAGATSHAAAGGSRRRVHAREAIAWVLAASGVAATAYLATRHEPAPVAARLVAELPDSVSPPTVFVSPFTHLAISRDGRRLAMIGVKGGTPMAYARRLDEPVLAPVRGSEGAQSVALSPDGEWLAFHIRNRGLFKVPILGGAPQLVTDTAGAYSPAIGESGEIVFRTVAGALLLAAADGSKSRRLVALDSAGLFDAPSLLPGGRDVLVSRGTGGGERGLALVSTADGHVTDLKMAGFGGSYSAGCVVFSRPLGMVFSAPFSLNKRAFTGPPTLLLQGVAASQLATANELAVAGNGTLVYLAGAAAGLRSMVSVDRQGVEQLLAREDRLYGEPRVSPDGKRIVMRIGESQDRGDVWIYDVGAGSLTPLTTDKKSVGAEWSRDGTRVITVDNVSKDSIFVQSRPWDGNGGVQTLQRGMSLLKGAGVGAASIGPPHGWSAFRVNTFAVGDIAIAPTDSLQALRPFVATPAAENMPRVSPDGRLLAYSSSKSGHNEVYLRPIPGPGPEVAVSTGGGQEPVWSTDGGSLFYRGPSRMMVATITEKPAAAVTRRDSLFVDRWDHNAPNGAYDVFPDGKRFVMTRPAKTFSEKSAGLFVVMNWPQLAGKQGFATDGR